MLVAADHHLGEAHEVVDNLALEPALAGLGQMVGHLEVAQGDDGFDAVFEQLIKQIVVELQSGLVGLGFVAPGEDAGPGDAGTETLETHLRQQGHVFLVVMVEVDGLVVGVVLAGLHAVGDATQHAVSAARQDIHHAGAFAPLIPAPFKLVRGHGAAP